MIEEQFELAIAHSIAAYHFAIDCIPTEARFTSGESVREGRFEFKTAAQAESIVIELGWAFFARVEAALEAYAARLGFRNNKGDVDIQAVRNVLRSNEELLHGYNVARRIRNTLHHGDGDPSLLRNSPKHLKVSGLM